MSTVKTDTLESATTNGDLTIQGNGTGVPNLEAGTKLNGASPNTANGLVKLDGSGALPAVDGSALTGVGGGLQSVQVFTASGTWTKPAGINSVRVIVVGGGGGGAGSGTNGAGPGGAGGGTAIEFIDVTGTSSETVTVGAGGTAGTSTGSGGTGGTSSFGAFCSATGGFGGTVNGYGSTVGGAGSGGDVNITGHPGCPPFTVNGSPHSGPGGGSFIGPGAETSNDGASSEDGRDAVANSGGGGSGGDDDGGPDHPGGAGGSGIVIVEEYA